MFDFGEEPQPLVLDVPPVPAEEKGKEPLQNPEELPIVQPRKTVPPKHDEIIWAWKVRITPLFFMYSSITHLFLNSLNWKRHEEHSFCSMLYHHIVIAPSGFSKVGL